MFELTVTWLIFCSAYENSTMFDLTITWLISFSGHENSIVTWLILYDSNMGDITLSCGNLVDEDSAKIDLTVTWLIFFSGYEDPWHPDPGPATDNNGTTPPGSLLLGVHPLPHTDLTVRTLPHVRGTSGDIRNRSTGTPARLHDHRPPRPAPLTGTPNGGLPNKPPPPGHDGKFGFPREISLTGPHNSQCVSELNRVNYKCISRGMICLNVKKQRIILSECTSNLMAVLL